MLGTLMHVVDKVKPLLPGFRIETGGRGFEVFTTKPRYTMGFKPTHTHDEEVFVAALSILPTDDGLEVTAMSAGDAHKFRLTVPDSGRIEKTGDAEGWAFDWRFEEAAVELAACLKKSAESM